jgi:hypothetical protein
LSKRLKKKLLEVCGFTPLSKEERKEKAKEILNSSELKQEICHRVIGISHKDVEKVMRSIIQEREPPKKDRNSEDVDEIEEYAPEKIFPEYTLPILVKPPRRDSDDPHSIDTYSKKEAEAMVAEFFDRTPRKK